MNSCIRIVKEDNSKPYLFYEQSGYWNIEFIAKKNNASGYIVQEVELINTTTIPDIDECVRYYEAWRVVNGKCADDEKNIPDDTFGCGFEGIENLMLQKSLGKVGEVKYICRIYWIDEADDHFEIVNSWKEGGVVYADKLKSVLVKDCPKFADMKPVCDRDIFVHRVNFVDRQTVKEAIIDCYSVRIKNQDELLQCDLAEILDGTIYEDLVKEICVENKLPYDMVVGKDN